jgi:hypothetical protein
MVEEKRRGGGRRGKKRGEKKRGGVGLENDEGEEEKNVDVEGLR